MMGAATESEGVGMEESEEDVMRLDERREGRMEEFGDGEGNVEVADGVGRIMADLVTMPPREGSDEDGKVDEGDSSQIIAQELERRSEKTEEEDFDEVDLQQEERGGDEAGIIMVTDHIDDEEENNPTESESSMPGKHSMPDQVMDDDESVTAIAQLATESINGSHSPIFREGLSTGGEEQNEEELLEDSRFYFQGRAVNEGQYGVDNIIESVDDECEAHVGTSVGEAPQEVDSGAIDGVEDFIERNDGRNVSSVGEDRVDSGSFSESEIAQVSISIDDDEEEPGTPHDARDSFSGDHQQNAASEEASPSGRIETQEGEDQFEEVELKEPGEFRRLHGDLKAYSSDDVVSEKDLDNNANEKLDSSSQYQSSSVINGLEATRRMPSISDIVHVENSPEISSGGIISFRSLDSSPIKQEVATTTTLRPMHSVDGSGIFPSPRGSPLVQKAKTVLPDIPPELLNLIDSVIQGSDRTSLLKLRRIVGGEEIMIRECFDTRESVARCVVDTLIAKMGGVDGLDEVDEDCAPRMMLSAGAAIVAGEILPWLPCEEGDSRLSRMSPRTRMAKALALVLQACTRNRAMCSAAGLLQVLLSAYQSILLGKVRQKEGVESWDTGSLLDAVEALGSHCLTVKNLREWLSTAAKISATGKSLDLLLTLERTMSGGETRGPSHSFEFDGESSGLLGPGESKWPFVNGYAFATWLYIESFADTVNTAAAAAAIASAAAAKTGKSSAMSAAAAASALAGEGTAHMPRLFSFLSLDNLGVEAYFHGQFLVVESVNGKGRKASLHFTHAFKPKRWYFVGLEHTHKQSLLGKVESEMRLYVDGRLYESRPLVFPRLSKPLSFCCIGTNPPPVMAGLQRRRRQCPLFAEMGPIYIFKEPLGHEKMAHLASRGGDVLPLFGVGAGAPWLASSDQAIAVAEESAALDLELGPKLHLLYHPKLLSGRSCPDASPTGASGAHRKPAEVLGHVHVAARIRPTESIWAMAEGGPLALLPLTVAAVHKESMQPIMKGEMSTSNALLAAPIFRMLSLALKYSGNTEEVARSHAARLLAHLLGYLVCLPAFVDPEKHSYEQAKTEERDEELVAAVVSVAQAPQNNAALKVQLFSSLLLDLKLWSTCSYGLQKKLLSTLADMVFSEEAAMRGANAVQVLLDGCRRCYWLIPEPDSIHTFADGKSSRHAGELNALVDELLVVVELLVGSTHGSALSSDVSSLIQFVLDCPQPNQVARVLHLIYRLVVQPNTSKAATFVETFLGKGGVEMLLTLLRREAEFEESDEEPTMDQELVNGDSNNNVSIDNQWFKKTVDSGDPASPRSPQVSCRRHRGTDDIDGQLPLPTKTVVSVARSRSAAQKAPMAGTLGGISLSISADRVRNKFRNVDSPDGIMVGIVSLLGALVSGGHLKAMSFGLAATQPLPTSSGFGITFSGEGSSGIPATAVVWLLYALERAFQAAPRRLLTVNVYAALLPAVIRSENGLLLSDDRLALYDAGHRFEHTPFLLVLLRALPFSSKQLQLRVLQDMLLLACTHSENRTILMTMPEWPEWLLEILLSNYEASASGFIEEDAGSQDIEDLVYSFITIMLEHSMRLKDGWKDVEATIHCAEWLALVGGPSSGEGRQQREELLPVIKRKLLCILLDFASMELQLQTQVVAAAAAGVAAEGLSPRTAKAEAEAAASLSMSLAENALVLLMLVEDHLRLETQAYHSTLLTKSSAPTLMSSQTLLRRSFDGGPENFGSRRFNLSGFDVPGPSLENSPSQRPPSNSETGSLSLEVLASMADENGQISATAMERLTASAAAEPYDSVRCAFACYGSYGLGLAHSWKRRSQMWYGVGLPQKDTLLSGGGGGFEAWSSELEKDADGQWVELPLVRKCIMMLQALLLDQYGPGAGGGGLVGFGGGAGFGSGGVQLQQLLDSDQPFFAMLRIALLALREEDKGELSAEGTSLEGSSTESSDLQIPSKTPSGQWPLGSDSLDDLATTQAKSSLLRCVLQPLLTMQLFESRRQRVLVACCILYSEVWQSVSEDRDVLRKQYVKTIVPPFAALLRRWRPLLSGIHELTDSQGQSPLAVEDRPLATDVHPLEAALAMISPAWAAAFASPPAAMALAMAAAGVGGGEASHRRHNIESLDRRSVRLISLPTFQKAPDTPEMALTPADKAASKAAALAAARDQERAARVGSGRGLGAVAMATSGQRRSLSDKERVKRWNIAEAMGNVWLECDTREENTVKSPSGPVHRMFGILPTMMDTAKKLQLAEVKRRAMAAATAEFGSTVGGRAWRSLLRRLQEMEALFGAISSQIGPSQRVFWKLDSMENSLRMRKRLKRNYKGTDHHGAAADYQEPEQATISNSSSLANTPLSEGAPKLAPEEGVLEEPGEEDLKEQHGESAEGGESEAGSGEPAKEATESVSEGTGSTVSASPQATNAAVVAVAAAMSTEPKEKLIFEIPAAMVQPLKVLRGRFKVTTKRICFMLDDRVYINEKGVASILEKEDDWEVVGGHEEKDEIDDISQQRKEGAKDRLWPMSGLREVHTRRFSLRRSALELFMVDRSNFFFNFGTVEARLKVYKAIVQAKPPHLNTVFAGTQRPDSLLKRSLLTDRWARREISNFEYLMQLNTIAGRTYNDVTQYPVFPWILADYTSEELNLNDPGVYRDLSKPIGALNPTRLEKFLERYDNFDDPIIPKFHYGSHYSSAGTILYYLVRIEPYSTLAIQLQGGKFDHADRMFFDMASTWKNVLEDMSDVKELVPELFYLPEALTNANRIDLGRTQKGEKLEDVKLPPWASSPEDFVQKHRAALESEYVSQHLNEWIDLVFGYKQRGPEAAAAKNVFFYMTYEGAVDIDKITDTVLRKATQDQITYFGQTPSQLLTTPHTKRMPLVDALHLQTIFRNPNTTKAYAIPTPERLNLPAVEVRATRDTVITVDMEVPACHVAVQKWQPNHQDGRGMPFLFHHGRSNLGTSGGLMRMFSRTTEDEENHFPKAVALAPAGLNLGSIVAITPDGRHLLTGGHADNSVKMVATDTARAVESALGHCAPVTCLSLSPDGSTLVTGSRDTTAILWRIHGSSGASTTSASTMSDPGLAAAAAAAAGCASSNPEGEGNVSFVTSRRRHVEGPLHVLRGHVDELLCCCVNADLDLVVTSSRTKGVLLHSITRGRFLRRLAVDRADLVALSPEGIVIVFDKVSRVLQTFTVNGVLVTAKLLPSWEGNISSIVISKDGLHAVIGTSCGRPVPSDTRLQALGNTTSNAESGRYSSQLYPQWSMVGPCPSCGGKARMHTASCSIVKSNDEPTGLQRFDTRPSQSPSGIPRTDSTIVMRRSESGLVRYTSSMRLSDEGKGKGGRQAEDSGGLRRGESGSTEFRPRADPQPAIILLEVHTLEVIQKFMLRKGQDITAMALNTDNSNLVVSTADKQLLIFTDPALSAKVLNEMIRLNWEGGGLTGFL